MFCSVCEGLVVKNNLMMRIKLLIVIFFLIIIPKAFSQVKSSDFAGLKRNSVYGTAGILIEDMYGNITANYERILFTFPKSFVQAIQLRAGAGPWVAWMSDGVNFFSVMSLLMGKSNSHLETGMGVIFTYHPDTDIWAPIVNDRHIAGNIGYRYQKPGGWFVFRTGLGWPEGMYLSFGYCF
jgi:hypothetical protein